MANLFQYPKSKHTRVLNPRQFTNYRTYKKFLKVEFERVCIYCRQPDCTAPNINFGVDHYRPKGIQKFAHLVCDYGNLYYCCANCNSRKNNDWPADEVKGPYFVNPCDHEMADHLRFNNKTGEIVPQSPHGVHMESVLQLNEPASVQYRLSTLLIIRLLTNDLKQHEEDKKEIDKLLKKGEISLAVHQQEIAELDAYIAEIRLTIQMHDGSLPLPAIKLTKLGISMFV